MPSVFKNMRLFPKFLCFVLPFLFFSIVFTSSVVSLVSYRFFQSNIRNNYSEIVKASAGEIRQYMVSSQKGLLGLARVLSATKVDLWQQDMALNAFRLAHPEFVAISILTPEAYPLVSTRVAGTGKKENLAREEAFQKALAGKTAFSGTRFNEENIPYANVGVPVFSLGRVTGVLWGELSLKSVWKVLERIRVGETGMVYIVNASGRHVVHLDMEKVIQEVASEDSSIAARLAEAGGEPHEWTEEREGRRAYCLSQPIADLEWTLVLSQEDREVYAYAYSNMRWTALLTLLLCLVAPVIVWLPVRRFLGPIHNLHGEVQRIGQGELERRIEVQSSDEIGELSASFNTMADSLKSLIAREVELAKELVHARNLATLGAAAGKVTHEVGNLLGNIAFIILKLKRESLSQGAQATVGILEKESERVNVFLRSFLQFAKKPELRLMKVSLESVLQEILAVHAGRAEEREIRIELDWSSDLPMVNVDVHLFYQVVNNLVKNSLEAMTEPGVISLEGAADQEWLQLTVRDTGSGIEPQVLERIFNPFYTTKGKKGTGLGLSICKSIMEAHRGTIDCSSEPGQFTAFTLRLPLQ